jgi:hypothetical protein
VPLVFLRFFLLISVLAIVGALIAGVVLKDRRWFRFAWQVLKFTVIAILVVAAAIITGRLILLI